MDPLSVTASILTVLQATGAVISICCHYKFSVKGSSWELPRMLKEIRDLRSVLQVLEELADKAETPGSTDQSRLPALKALCDPNTGALSSCCAELEKLNRKLTPPGWSGAAGSKRRSLIEALSWPLKKGDTEKVLKSIERFKSTIKLAVEADQITSIHAIEDTTQDMKINLLSLKDHTHGQNIRNWLHAMDPYPKYWKTLEERQAGTGSWLANGGTFASWSNDPNSLLWLHGIPGCGKTVLCSTAIERALEQRKITTEKAVGVAFFYFDFNDQDQQRDSTMLRSLIAQLWQQTGEEANAVDELYLACSNGGSQPSSSMLMDTLQKLLQNFADVFILFDALDECMEIESLMENIEQMAGWKVSSLHMLVTSRMKKEIEESLPELLHDERRVCIQSAHVEGDIRMYIQNRIQTDRRLKKWQKEVQAEIETILVEKAGSMFQWVKCQLNALGCCLSLYDLRRTLRSLPKDLDDTYARILQSIDENGFGEPVARIMQWLTYSTRTMSLTEFVELLTVDVEGDPQVNIDRRLVEPDEILTMCSDLVSTVRQVIPWDPRNYFIDREEKTILQFAHFSVREYLGSSRLQDGPGKKFALHENRANTFMAEVCIIYLLQFNLLQASLKKYPSFRISKEFPLAEYAAMNWDYHAEKAEENGKVTALCEEFLLSKNWALHTWAKIRKDCWENTVKAGDPLTPSLSAFALSSNLARTVSHWISKEAEITLKYPLDWTALLMVSQQRRGHVEVIQVLLDHGAEVTSRKSKGASALVWAFCRGHVQVVLEERNTCSPDSMPLYKTALLETLRRGHTEFAELLLKFGVM